MTDPFFLTENEVEMLTGKKRPSAQLSAVLEMGLVARPRLCDNFPLVSREYLKQEFGVIVSSSEKEKAFVPDYAALEAVCNG